MCGGDLQGMCVCAHVGGDQYVQVIPIKVNFGSNSAKRLFVEFPRHPTAIYNINIGGSRDISHPCS